MKVRELLDSPEKWIQGEFAVDASGHPVSEISPTACKWCLSGAVYHCYPSDPLCTEVRSKLKSHLSPGPNQYVNLASWNDSPDTTWEMVKDLLDKADV